MKKIVLLLAGALLALPAGAGTLLVAAASDLAYCIDALGAAFRKEAPDAELKVTLGASGNLFAQIKSGAPFDVLLSADMEYPLQLAREGAAERASLTPYALGRIALWSLDPRFDLRQGLRVLDDSRITRIAIANPAFAPYGRAAKAALEQQGLWQAVQPKLAMGENVSQAAQFVQSGNAQVGIISLASVLSPRLKGSGRHYVIPSAGLAPIEQGAIVTTHGRANPLAARFVAFLASAPARALLSQSGYGLPPRKTGAHD